MKFFTHKRALPPVPIISLIDILAILLIFFIATTTFKKQESLVKINLPKSSEMEANSENTVRVVLALTRDNEIYLGEEAVPIEQLAAALKQLKEQNPDGRLELKADREAEVGLLVRILDAGKQAGVDIGKIPLRILLDSGSN